MCYIYLHEKLQNLTSFRSSELSLRFQNTFQNTGVQDMITFLVALAIVAWVAVVVLGSQAYFRGEQSKPIHERNWNSDSFETIAESVTGGKTNYTERVPGFVANDAYASRSL